MNQENLSYIVLTDKKLASDKLLRATRVILENGVDALVYKRKKTETYESDAKVLKEMADEFNTPFLVHKDVDLAKSLGAGLYLTRLADFELQLEAFKDSLVYASVKTIEDAKTAHQLGADKVLIGHAFDKEGNFVLDKKALFEVRHLGFLLYGGISTDNISILAGTGASGLAIGQPLYTLPNPTLMTKRLKERMAFVLNPKPRLKAALLDIDGVLTDTLAVWQDLAPEYLRQNDYTPGPDLIEILEEKSLPEQVGYIKHNYSFLDGVGEVIMAWLHRLDTYYKKEAERKLGAKEFLSLLGDKGIAKKAYTLSPSELMTGLLKAVNLQSLVDGLESGWNDKFEGHDERFYNQVAGAYVMDKNEVYIFEDSLFALRAASRAGYKTVAIFDENHKRGDWKNMIKEADLAFYNLEEARLWLGE